MSAGVDDDTDRGAPRWATSAGRRGRGGVWAFVAGVAVVVVLGLAGLVVLGRLVPTVPNPFATDRVERTGPAVLQALEDLSEYRAATGHFQVLLDVEEHARYLPPALAGERTLFVAAGTVDATVDFSGLSGGAVRVSDDRSSARIVLPAPRLSAPRIDLEESYVYEHRRGLLDRIGGLLSDEGGSQRELYLLAQERLGAAAGETDLIAAAERNTRAMLESLLGSLGFTEVEVAFR
ncbi:MAG TPA: DUF4230 domain-containing protein [Egibacteraceae bacterium]|nr:DUF4230 domain-containing protein [Egibacteraceae bacterium]